MAGLAETTAKLSRYRRQFEKLLSASAARPTAVPSPKGRLTEIAGFGANPGNLRMLTYVPSDCPPGAPLVVVLHGCTQNADGYDTGSGWSTLADRFGFALLFPEQQRSNNPNNCFNWFLPGDITRGSGEALSIREMIDKLVCDQNLDERRIFVTGLSAGGAMAAVMLATYPEIFAGGAIIAGLPYGVAGNVQEALDAMFQGKRLPARDWGDRVRNASEHRGPWPRISIWHGDADRTVQPSNAAELIKQWTNVHGSRRARSDRFSERPSALDMAKPVWRNPGGILHDRRHGARHADQHGGTDAVGAQMPFMLEAGISSSHQIASFWGLSEPATSKPAPAPVKTPASRELAIAATEPRSGRVEEITHVKSDTRLARGGRLDPHAVITKALRSAGLMK